MIIDTPLVPKLTGPGVRSVNYNTEREAEGLTHKLGCFYNASGADLAKGRSEGGDDAFESVEREN